MIRFFLSLLMVFLALSVRAADAPLPPQDAAKHMTLPDGFSATLFAGEPDVVQPIAFTFDDRGRLWVVENLSYPGWKGDKKDRVLIFEDADGDGVFDKRTVFLEDGSNLSGIEIGFGGVWLLSLPNVIFIPVKDGEDKPAGPPVVKLDGWDMKVGHNAFNSLCWGPDGWLYGCNGIQSNSKVGKPGTPDENRTPMNCGVWRYHPIKETFEAVAHGTTNPWGLDFDDFGEAFITNCVINHVFHVTPGAHFQRMYGQDFNPYAYRLMEGCADHFHWVGSNWTEARGGEPNDAAGGGHAHVGAMVYLGDNWPDEYRNHIFMCNVHGNRVNQDILERKGSGYVAHHGKDFLLAHDPWFRGLALKYGPDGGVYVSDWTDTGECHNYEKVDQTNGRIYKVVYGKPKPWKGDLSKLSDAELVKLQQHKNDWFVRHARRLLQERAAADKWKGDGADDLLKCAKDDPDVRRRLRALWTLHAAGKADEKLLLEMTGSDRAEVRGWAARLALEDKKPTGKMVAKLQDLAAKDPSSYVRLQVASDLQRLPLADRWPIAEALLTHAEDANDAELPLMTWYGVEPLAAADPERALKLGRSSKIPLVGRFLVRRVVFAAAQPDKATPEMASWVRALAAAPDDGRRDLLYGAYEALEGRRKSAMPEGWAALYPKLIAASKSMADDDADVRDTATLLALIFGDRQAFDLLRKTAADDGATASARRKAVEALAGAKDAELPKLLRTLLDDKAVSGAALRALAAYDDRDTPQIILEKYADFAPADRQAALSTLSSRPAYALALLDALEQKKVPRTDVTSFQIADLQNLKDDQVVKRLGEAWGAVRTTPAEKAALIKKYQAALSPESLKKADLSAGRAVFKKSCATCHVLFDDGARIGPELTGSQRANLDYVLANVVDPSAVVAKEYQVTLIQTTGGRVVQGVVKSEDERVVRIQTAKEVVNVPKEEIDARKQTTQSLMPDGLLEAMTPEEVRDLVGYLGSPVQIPPPAEKTGGRDP
jgi:putative membrane-bound dehydrogenase-like protein